MPFTRLRQSMIKPNGSITGSLSGTSSYSRRSLTASYALNASGGSISYITGSPVVGQYIVVSGSSTTQYALIQSVSNPEHLLVSVNGVVQNYSSSYTVTGSTLNFYQSYDDGDEIDVRFLNGGTTVQTGSIAKQTLWTNVTSGSTNTITGLSLSSNKWDVSVVEEWDAATLDQYYNSSSLLCHFDSVNAGGRFIDNSRNNFAITSSGGAGLSTSQYKFGGASLLLDGTNDYLSTTHRTNFNVGAADFTIEAWVYTGTISQQVIFGANRNADGVGAFMFNLNYTGKVRFFCSYAGGSFLDYNVGTGTISDSVWHHVAVTRNGSSLRIFIDGIQTGTTNTTLGTAAIDNAIADYRVGSSTDGYLYFNGYIDDLRVTKGVARYTGNFTPRNSPFPNSRNQVLTRYVGLVGGIDDKYVDYGVQKLSNSSLKLTRITYPNQPIVGSGSLSGSVSRVYVNVLDYTNVSISGSISNAVTASFALTSATSLDIPKIKSIIYTNSSYTPTTASAVDLIKGNKYIIISGSNFKSSASVFIDATTGSIVNYVNANRLNVNVATKAVGTYPIYLMNTDGASTFKINAITYITGLSGTQKAIFGYGYTNVNVSMTNLVSNTGTVATDTTGVGTNKSLLAAAGYGTDKAIFGYGDASGVVSMTNLVSNTGVVATNTTGVGTARYGLAAAGYGTDKAIFGYGYTGAYVSMTNLVNNTGVVATDTTGVGTGRFALAAAGYGSDKAIFGYGWTGAYISLTNLVSNTGVVATDTTGVGTGRYQLAAAGYGTDKAIFGYGYPTLSMTNLVNNTGVVATDTTGVGTARHSLAAAGYGGDKAIFGYGLTSGVVSMTNKVSNTGVVATDTTGVGTAREGLAAAGYSTS